MAIYDLVKSHLINVRMLTRVMGWLLFIETLFMLFPLAACIYYGHDDWKAFAIAAGITVSAAFVSTVYSRPRSSHLGKRDAFLLTALVWVVFTLFGLIPFMLCDHPLGFTDAFFEAMSGFTTTGTSVIPDIDAMSRGIHLWRAIMQWVGGMGIVLFTLAIIPSLNHSGGMQMFNAEVTGITHDKIRPRISQTAKVLWRIYMVLTILLILLLWVGPMNFFDSVCHALSAISTGGFSDTGLGISRWHYNLYVKIVLTVFMFLGGVNFGIIFRVSRGDFKAMRNDVFRAFLCIIGATWVLFVISIFVTGTYEDWQDLTINPLFHIVAVITSTGFTASNFEMWGAFPLALTFVLMFMGACSGSTTGGAKVDRILFLFKNARNELFRSLNPYSVMAVRINGKVVSPDLVSKVIGFLCIYSLLIIGGGIALTACGTPIVDAFFSSFSCMSNTGLGAGVTSGGYETLRPIAKWILSALMLIGRLEIFTVLVLFTRAFWRR